MTQAAIQVPPARPVAQTLPAAEAPSPALGVTSYGASDRGLVRENNEDQFAIATLARALWVERSSVRQPTIHYGNERGHLFIVADGVGGARAGDKASAIAVGVVESFLLNALQWVLSLDEPAEAMALKDLKAALQRADASVCAAAARDPRSKGMGTTLTLAYAIGADLFVAHVGDSRCYLQRGGGLHQITRDHTLVQDLMEQGVLKPGDKPDERIRHVITNVVGGGRPGVKAEVHRVPMQPGDIVLLCTDGLTGMVSDEQITSCLVGCSDPRAACNELITLAKQNGGEDNVTVVIAKFA